MVLPRFHFLEKLLDAYYIRQIAAFTKWLARHSLERERVFIDLPRQERSLNSGSLAYIFCAPEGLSAALQKNDRHDTDAWCAIFRSAEYEIWEYAKKHEDSAPLRHGLSDEEKNFALAYARKTLDEYLKTGKRDAAPAENIPGRFLENATVDVALWVRGALRGSRIVEDMPFMSALREAAIRACRDERFKPLAAAELDATIIEIAVLSDLRMPLLGREMRANTIAVEKGYVLSAQGRKGWFLPAVLNGVTFKNLDDFLAHLIEKKAGVPKTFLSAASVGIFEVDNFVESSRLPRTALALRGPVVKRGDSPGNARHVLDAIATRGADFLCRVQEADGNIPPIIDPLTGKKEQIDWVRLALSAWALARMGNVGKNSRYEQAARKTLTYIVDNLYDHPFITGKKRCSTFLYAYRLATELGEVGEAARMHREILGLLPELPYEPILSSQIALHLLESDREDAASLAKVEAFSKALRRDYEQRISSGDSLELARFPELIPLLRTVGNMRDDQEMVRRSEAVSEWYVSQQLPDGSFPSAVGSHFSYVRGSGKIFEVLCLEPEKNKACIGRTINWLSEMQYDEDNAYFVEEGVRKEISGGFRHDYVNQAVWIDAVGHVLIGATRLQAAQKTA